MQKNLNALLIVILSGILTCAFLVQFFYEEEPCPLCLLQRLGMIGAACGAALNMRFGIRMPHYGIILASCLLGGAVALRQITLHICPGFTQFGIPVLGLSLYTWSFLVFTCTVAFVALLLFLYHPKEENFTPMNRWCDFALGFLFLVVLVNALTTFHQCGMGACTG